MWDAVWLYQAILHTDASLLFRLTKCTDCIVIVCAEVKHISGGLFKTLIKDIQWLNHGYL